MRLAKSITCYRFLFFVSAVGLSMSQGMAHANETEIGLGLEVGLAESLAVEIAVRVNPNLAEMQVRYEALSQIPSQVGTLPDPMVNLNAMNFPTDNIHRCQEAMTQAQIGFSQEMPNDND